MKIIAGEHEIPIIQIISRTDLINGTIRDVLEVQSESPFTAEQVAAMADDPNWKVDHGEGYVTQHLAFQEPVRYSVWMAKVNPTEAQLETLINEKAALIAELDALVSELPSLLEGKSEEIILKFQEYLPEAKIEQPIVYKPIASKI